MDDLITAYSSPAINVEIPDFELNKFLLEILKEEDYYGDFLYKSREIKKIEVILNTAYLIYKKNPADYNKFIEIEQKNDKLFFTESSILPWLRNRFSGNQFFKKK